MSIFSKRYQCLQLVKTEAEDIINYAGKVNRACEDFDFKNMKIDQFKCLVFVCGLRGHGYADIRARLLSRIENEVAGTPVTLQTLIDDYQRLVNLQADTSMIERPSFSRSTVHALQEKNDRGIHRQKQPSKPESKTPRTPCWQCGQMHYVRDCSFANHMCKECKRVGHKEGYCSCFSKQKSVKPEEGKMSSFKSSKSTRKAKSRDVYVVNHIAQHSNKRKYVPTFINDVATKLQLDTPSDIMVISKQTWNYVLGKTCNQETNYSSHERIRQAAQVHGRIPMRNMHQRQKHSRTLFCNIYCQPQPHGHRLDRNVRTMVNSHRLGLQSNQDEVARSASS
ncbi:uncharacterized protein LOC134208846 [Armigeres subalbatus]|uniref:uncharacterized protein LOC134208846 n=1 Tax=Armigeres subalbatus TaxID=124917 RepID=UPI002ED17E89